MIDAVITDVPQVGTGMVTPDEDVDVVVADAAATNDMSGEQILFAIMSMPNIAEALLDAPEGGKNSLSAISARAVEDYELDESSRKEWLKKNEESLKLAMLVSEEKNYPFENAANIKFPLLTTAALQFNARAYPAIVPPDRVVKVKVRGRDEQGLKAARADRVGEFMSDQLLQGMPEWEEDTDRILIMLPIVGSVFRKFWYDPGLKRNRSKLVTAADFVVNFRASSLEATPRFTEKLRLYPYEIEERIRDGRFLAFEYQNTGSDDEQKTNASGENATQTDDDGPQLFLEQHRLLDLDEDGYPEPYIVTIHKATAKVVRIVANYNQGTVTIGNDGRVAAIRRQDYFVHYQFMPNPEGGFYGLGFGWLLSSTNETINSTLNQLLDAGHMANMQGGLISSVLGVKEKNIKLERGEWRILNTTVPLNQAVMPMTYKEPSAVLFNLLGLMIDMGKEVAAVKDVLTGEGQGKNASPTTTLALIEQGLQVFTSIYKRIHRTLKHEFGICGRLNAANVTPEEYTAFFDDPSVNPQSDFNEADMDVLPVSDPQSVTKMQKLAKAEMIMNVGGNDPLFNPIEVRKRFLEAADVEDVEKLLVQPPQPDPEEAAFMDAVKKLGLQQQVAEINNKIADTLKKIADAEAAEEGMQMSYYDLVMKALGQEHAMEQEIANQAPPVGAGGIPDMAGQSDNGAGAGLLPPAGIGGGGIDPTAPVPVGGPAIGPGMGQPASPSGISQGAL
jgi:chaperonin GroES